MRTLILTLFATIVATSSAFSITLEEIMAKNVAARGGDKLKAVQTFVIDGRMSMAQGMELKMTQTVKRPNKIRMDMTVQGMSIIQAFDGTTGWAVNPMSGGVPEKLSEAEGKNLKDRANIDGMLASAIASGHKVELIGLEDLDGASAYKIKVTDTDNDVSYVFIDATTWLETQVRTKTTMMGQEADVEIVFTSYQEVGGVQFPMEIEMRADGETFMTISYSNPKINVDVPDSRFAFPASGSAPSQPKTKKN